MVDAISNSAMATRREWLGLAVIALPCMLYSMDLTVLHLAVPSLSADLKPGSSELLWIVDIYGFMVAGLLITMGNLGDRIGRRRLLLIGAVVFGLASTLAAFSTSALMLIVSRAVLGVAGATIAPSTLSLIRNMFFDAKQRTTAIGVWVASFSAGAAAGPVLGGLLIEFFWWGSVFLIAVPVMILLLVAGPRLLPEYRDPNARRLDPLSVGLSLAAVLAIIYGLKRIAEGGLSSMPTLFILAGLSLGAVFVRRQTKLSDPLIDLRLFRSPAFSTSISAYALATFVAFGTFLFTAQYLQLVLGLSPLLAGVWSLPSASAFIIGSMIAPIIVRRVRPRFVMSACLALAAVGFTIITRVEPAFGLAFLVTGSVVFAISLSPVITLATDLVISAAPPERAGAAAGISETSSEFGGALGLALLGSIGAAIYRGNVSNAIPAGLSPEAAEAARGSLGGALSVIEQLPPQLGADLLRVARDAFTQSLVTVAAVSAGIVLVTALASFVLMRQPRTGSDAVPQAVPILLAQSIQSAD